MHYRCIEIVCVRACARSFRQRHNAHTHRSKTLARAQLSQCGCITIHAFRISQWRDDDDDGVDGATFAPHPNRLSVRGGPRRELHNKTLTFIPLSTPPNQLQSQRVLLHRRGFYGPAKCTLPPGVRDSVKFSADLRYIDFNLCAMQMLAKCNNGAVELMLTLRILRSLQVLHGDTASVTPQCVCSQRTHSQTHTQFTHAVVQPLSSPPASQPPSYIPQTVYVDFAPFCGS